MHGYTIDIHWVLMDTVEEVHMIAFPRRAMGMRTCTADQTILQIHSLLENFDEDNQICIDMNSKPLLWNLYDFVYR
jgi:hypothetical protein